MPPVQVSMVVPYMLFIPEGDYSTGEDNPSEIRVEDLREDNWEHERLPLGKVMSFSFEAPDNLTVDEIEKIKYRQARRLLAVVNRFLRWYRSIFHGPEVTELTLAQASPFCFDVKTSLAITHWRLRLEIQPDAPRTEESDVELLGERVRSGFCSGQEPDLADLLLVDAQQARLSGRFREAVILSWSTIEGSFLPEYARLVREFLPADLEWNEGTKWLSGVDYGLRNKMTVGLRSVIGTSMYTILGKEKWDRLGQSYRRRNSVVHEGATVTEEQAQESLDVADDILRAIQEVCVKAIQRRNSRT